MEKEELKSAIARFLEMCVNYADDSIERKKGRLEENVSEDLKKEIEKWISYREFTEYAVKEVLEGELDDWLEKIINDDV